MSCAYVEGGEEAYERKEGEVEDAEEAFDRGASP